MEFTGERVIPGQVDPDLWNEHYGRYAFAAWVAARRPPASQPLRVLDAGCGSGYGSALLASAASSVSVTGCDISAEAIAYANEHYAGERVRFVQDDCAALSKEQFGEFDLVVSFEVIEHLSDPAPFLTGMRSVLAAGGWAIASTPNRRYYTEERDFHNPFHAREYDTAEFDALLAGVFDYRATFVQNHAAAVSFVGQAMGHASSPAQGGVGPVEGHASIASTPSADDQPYFVLAVCANSPLPELPAFVFVPSAGNVLREREEHIRKLAEWKERLEAELASRDATVRSLQAELEQSNEWARGLDNMLLEARDVINARDKELEERTAWARSLQAEVEKRTAWARSVRADLDRSNQALTKLQQEFDERTAWAQRLDSEVNALRADLALLLGSFWYRAGKKLRASPVPACDRR